MMKATILTWAMCLLLLTAGAQDPHEVPVTLQTATGVIHGKIRLPEHSGALCPVVLLIAGSGPTDMDGNNPQMKNNSLKMLAENLCAEGIATLRYDKRGIASSEAAGRSEADLRFEDYVNDAKDWIAQLHADQRFSEVVVAGHSEGSLIGMIACRDNTAVSGFVSLEGAGFPADEILKKQLASQPDPVKNIAFPIIDSLKAGKLCEKVPFGFEALFRNSVQPYMISWFRYDPAQEIASLTIPVLIIQGTSDIQVSEDDANRLHEANPASVLKILEGMNHVLKDCVSKDMAKQMPSYTSPDIPINGKVAFDVAEFVKKTVKKK